MTDKTTTIPDQPDGIEDDSYDLPELGRAAERVREYICAWGDGLINTADGHPLYARDLEALRRAGEKVDELTAERDEYAADNTRVVAQLVAANRHADGLKADLRSAVTANTAWANEVAELKAKLAASRNWFPARKRNEPAKRCNVEGCTDKHLALGYCVKHHARFKRTGDPLGVLPGSHEARLQTDACGTVAGHSRHRTRGEAQCDPCREAVAAYQREWRRRNKSAEATR